MSHCNNNIYYSTILEVLSNITQLESVNFHGCNLSTADVTIKIKTGEGNDQGSISLTYDYHANLKEVCLLSNNVRQYYMSKARDIADKIREACAKVEELYKENE